MFPDVISLFYWMIGKRFSYFICRSFIDTLFYTKRLGLSRIVEQPRSAQFATKLGLNYDRSVI